MTRVELSQQLGLLVGPARREAIGQFAAGKTADIGVRYDDVRDWTGMSKLLAQDNVAFADGEEWMSIWIGRQQCV